MISYIQEQGAKISKEGRRLIVTKEDTEQTIFIDQLEQLVLFGNVQLTAPALLFLLRENIDTVFLRKDGRYMGRLASKESANVFLRKRQFTLLENSGFCLNMARSIVQAKLLNQATVMARVKRARNHPEAGCAATALRSLALKAGKMQDIDALRGLEGHGAAIYFKHFPLALIEDWGFTQRVRRPPTDPVNAVLSLLYTLLTNRCYAAVCIAGLDPFPAALHTPAYGRHSLPLDLVEEFRAMLADTLTIALFNLNVLKHEDFVYAEPEEEKESAEETCAAQEADMDAVLTEPVGCMSPEEVASNPTNAAAAPHKTAPTTQTSEKLPVLLQKEALKRVLTVFAKKMESAFFHPIANRQMTYNDALIFQARMYRRVVEGEMDTYQPLTLR